jgi:hypothetical protein
VDPLDMRRDPLGIGDHQVALRHDGIVLPLQAFLAGIGAVIRRDEGHASGLRSRIGTPGRRAGPGMDKVYAFIPDDPFQLAFIEFQHDGILGFGVHAEQLAAQFFELAFQATAAAGQQGPAARFDDGFGHFQHGAFHAAC